jgi:hypothetical protein
LKVKKAGFVVPDGVLLPLKVPEGIVGIVKSYTGYENV